MRGLGAHYELEVACVGIPDGQTGYLVNIKAIDNAVRRDVAPIISGLVQRCAAVADASTALPAILAKLDDALGGLVRSVTWRLTPYYWLSMDAASLDRVLICQHFEFAAAHRLHCPQLSDQQNRQLFGKCNNASGHGHNYRLQVAVAVDLLSDAPPLGLPELERIVNETVIRRFDHTHLNHDTKEFATLNPSVENIARVCHDLLVEPIKRAGATLDHVTIWETEKTCCVYPARGSVLAPSRR